MIKGQNYTIHTSQSLPSFGGVGGGLFKIMKKINVLALGLVLLSACSGGEKNNSEQSANEWSNPAFLKSIVTEKAYLTNQEQELTLAGKVEYDPDKVSVYAPLFNGVVDRTYFSLGDKVQKGQNMLDIRSAEFSALESERISLETEVKIAQRELKSSQDLFDDNMLSEKELLQAQGNLKQAQTSLSKVKHDIAVFGTSKGNGIFGVKAPMNGYVVTKNVSAGSTVSENSDTFFTIADLSTVWIVANVYARNIQYVKERMEVEISSLSYPDETFSGKINSVSQVFDSEEKVLKARIVMRNNELKFKPEMSLVVRIKNREQSKSIAVPSEALIFDNNLYFVVVRESDSDFSAKEVTLIGQHDNISYLGSGLNDGDNVVVKNQLLIYSGLKEKN